jgi:hypothetical protein
MSLAGKEELLRVPPAVDGETKQRVHECDDTGSEVWKAVHAEIYVISFIDVR